MNNAIAILKGLEATFDKVASGKQDSVNAEEVARLLNVAITELENIKPKD